MNHQRHRMLGTSGLLLLGLLGLVATACSSSGGGNAGMIGGGGQVTVDATGSGDFTTIQGAITASAPGTVIQIAPGTYSGQIDLAKNVRLVGSGPATVLESSGTPIAFPDESSDSSSAVLVIRDTSDVIIENMTFSGPQDGIQVRNASRVTLRNVDASGNGDDGIDVRHSTDVTISGTFSNNGDKGVQVREGSSNVTVSSSRITQNVDRGIRFRDVTSCVLDGSTASNNGDDGIEVRDSSGVTLSGNTSSGNLGYGIRLRNSPTTVLQGNVTTNNTEGDLRQE